MTVFHCPVCPLIFEHRTEVEDHVRNDHRSRAHQGAESSDRACAVSQHLDRARLRALHSARRGVAVTIVMATTPSASMTGLDVARLRRLANRAQRRLAAEPSEVPVNLDARLARAVAAAEASPTQEGLVLLVDTDEMAIFHLPFEPADRAVVDPGFATRDLEVTMRWYPMYRLVALGHHPRLFEGRGAHLVEVDFGEPATGQDHRARGGDGRRAIRPERWTLSRSRRQVGVRLADQLIAARIHATGEMPLVIAGDGRWRAEFRRQSPHAPNVIAEIPGARTREPASTLGELAKPHLARRLRDQQAAAVAELEQADGHGSIVWGPKAAWTAVMEGDVDALWVEQSYARAGRTVSQHAVELVDNPEVPGIADDVVDDLIQAATASQVEVHLLTDRTTGRPEPVAARLRAGARPPQALVGLAHAV